MRRGVPENVERYTLLVINKTKVYVPYGFDSPHPLTVDVHNLFGLKWLYVEGWKPV